MDEELPRLPGFREAALRRRRETIGVLADHRRAAGLSQTELAARMGTSQSTIARLEAGEVDPRISTLERYADALGGRLDVTLRFDPAPAAPIPPGLPLLRPVSDPAVAPDVPAREFPAVPMRPAAHTSPPPVSPGSPAGPPGSPAGPLEPGPPDGDAPRRPHAAPLPPTVADPPARPTQRRW
ncbi:helix-turn-helix domain-containing protein [Cryptosporangium aurantiacum]|nr:helix-turn-helix transcriptional regulator [Cryptosporangium aurantiacum]